MKNSKLKKLRPFLIVFCTIFVFLTGIYLFLLSEYSLKHLWLPLASEKAGAEITAKHCSVSLFGKKTFTAQGLKVKKADLSAEIESFELLSSPLDGLFGKVFPIHSLAASGVTIDLKGSRQVRKNDGKQEQKSSARNDGKGDLFQLDLPVIVEKLSVSDLTFRFEQSTGEVLELREANAEVSRLSPNTRTELSTGGILFCKYGNIQVRDTHVTSRIGFTLPEKGIVPQEITLYLNTDRASVQAGKFNSDKNTLVLNSDMELKKGEILLKSCSLNAGSEQGDILALNFTGNILEGFDGSFLKGTLKLHQSNLTDAVCSGLLGAELSGLCANGSFDGRIEKGELHSEADLSISAVSLASGKLKGRPIRDPEIRATASLSGSPKKLSFVLRKASLNVRENNMLLGEATLLSPWQFLVDGAPTISQPPHVKILADRFPLSALIPFGLDPKYEKETVTLSLVSKPETDLVSDFTLDISTSFPVAELGPLTAHADLRCSEESVELRESRIFCGTKEKSVEVKTTGNMNVSPSSLEFDSFFRITNPEQVFKNPEFRDIKEMTPKLQGKCLFGKDFADIWLEGAGGKYRAGFSSKIVRPEANDGFWESRNSSAETSRLEITAGEEHLLDLLLDFRIREDFSLNGLKAGIKTQKVSPKAFREIGFLLPDDLNFDKSESKLQFSAEEKTGTLEISLDARCAKIILNGAKSGTLPLDLELSLSADWKDNCAFLKKCRLTAIAGKEKAADFNLYGTIPVKGETKKISLSLDSERMDLFTLQKVAQDLSRKEQSAAPAGNTRNTQTAQNTQQASAAQKKTAAATKKRNAVDLSPYHGSLLKFNLKRITYTDDLILELKGSLGVDGRNLTLKTETFTVNRQPGTIALTLDPGDGTESPFTASAHIRELPFAPVSKFLAGGEETGVSGTMKNLDLDLKGAGFSGELLMKKAEGTVSGNAASISVPVSAAGKSNLGKAVLLSLRALHSAIKNSDKISGTAIGKELQDISVQTEEILDGKRNLEFSTASGNILLQPGVFVIREFRLGGGVIDSESLEGYMVLPDGELKLNSEMNVRGIVVPVQIRGTMNKPKVNASKSAKDFLKSNAKELLKKDNLEKAVKSVNELIKSFR